MPLEGSEEESSEDLGCDELEMCIDWEDERRKNGMLLGVSLFDVDGRLGLRGVRD